MKKAIYALSGDPITFGHIDIIKRAAKVFDQVIIGIGINPKKEYMFTIEQRTEMAEHALAGIANVKVISFQGLLVDYAYENDISVIIKGVRNSNDFDYEVVLQQVSESQKLAIDTFFLPAKQDMAHISSSSAKALQLEHGLIHEFVPLYVKMNLEAKISGQYIVGVTGEIGAGKSYISEKFKEIGKQQGICVHHIELDHIGHQILSGLKEPLYNKVRTEIINTFGPGITGQDGLIDRKHLGKIVFEDRDKLAVLNRIMYTPLLVRLRRELYGKKGLILFNAALIAESGMSYLCNNNVLLVTVNKKSQEQRLKKRDLTTEQIEKRLKSQYDAKQKQDMIQANIDKSQQGKLWIIDNSDGADPKQVKLMFDKIINSIDIYGELRFKSLWHRLKANIAYYGVYNKLIAAYSESQRHYHSLNHIVNGLNLLNKIRPMLKEPDLIETAWWYHDVVYNPQNKDNERESAGLARDELIKAGLPEDFARKVYDCIEATNHKKIPGDNDLMYLLDMDMSILGADEKEFNDYEMAIKREYGYVSTTVYNQARKKFLEQLLLKGSIYYTPYFKSNFEEKTRQNITELVGKLVVRLNDN